MNIRDLFNKSTYRLAFSKNSSFSFASDDIDWKTTPDLDIILNKLSKSFISGSLIVINDIGETQENKEVPFKVAIPNLMSPDYLSLFYRYLYLLKKYGVSWFYFKSSSYFLLENDNCEIEYNRTGLLNADSFSSLIKTFRYTTNGKTYDLMAGDGEVVPIFDIGFSHDDYEAISRSIQIKEILKLNNGAIEALQGAFRRISMMLLTPKNDSNGINMVRVANMDDKTVVKENNKFNKMFSIKKNAISVLNKSYDKIDTNPDNRKLDATNSLNWAAERICNQYDYPYKLFRGETKFDDAEFTFSILYMQTLQPEADKLLKVICKNMKIKEKVRMDYTKVMEQSIQSFSKEENSSDTTVSDEIVEQDKK